MNDKIVLSLVTFIIISFFIHIYIKELKYKNYNNFKYNYREYENFITEKERLKFIKNINSNKYIEDNPLSDEFEKTRGLVINFNKSNDYNKFKSKGLEFIYDYYKKIRKSYATDFVFNILIIDSININDKSINEQSIKYHHDTTLDITYENKFITQDLVPEVVSVLYVDTPNNFKNGNLKMYKYSRLYHVGDVKPKKRKLVEFNGTIFHGVEKIIDIDNNNGKRISFVLEQYIKK